MSDAEPLLEVRDLRTYFHVEGGLARAVDGVSFTLQRGRTLGLVGESGCGKSVTSLSIMRLVPDPPGWIEGGEILFKGQDLLRLPEREMRKIRGNQISMVFQEPMTSLNPVFTCGFQVAEAVLLHQDVSKREAKERAVEMLRLVGIPAPEQRMGEYPHQLSGGMRQRVMIAMALACTPSLLIADEPTTALDVTIQAQILDLLKELQERFGMAILLITHDLGVIAEVVDEVAVMYASKIVEQAPVDVLFNEPLHPYTRGLLRSLPQLEGDQGRLVPIQGIVPDAAYLPSGCKFHPRCSEAIDRCPIEEPRLVELKPAHAVRCWVREAELAGESDVAEAPGG